MSAQIQQSNTEKNDLLKRNSELESKLKISQESVATHIAELEKMKKLVSILNSGYSKLDEILSAGRTEKEHFRFGYTGETESGQTVFVKGTSSGTNKEKDLTGKRLVATPIRTPVIMAPRRTSGVPPGGTLGRTRRRNWVPTCHYCNKRGHIRPRYF